MEPVFQSHFNAIRKRLTAVGEIANNFHHNTNKGNIRETFVRELLDDNTSQFCSVGSGEIIHRDMVVPEARNQIDVILYNNRFPKLHGANGVDLHFVETVSSFIEVKSTLKKCDIRKAAQATKKIKSYPNTSAHRFNPSGKLLTPRPYSFLFAYDATVQTIESILEWMKEVASEDDYKIPELIQAQPEQMPFFPHLFLDGVFVLNKGFVHLDAMPWLNVRAQLDKFPADHIWIHNTEFELEMLWAAINMASEKLLWNEFDESNYLSYVQRMASD